MASLFDSIFKYTSASGHAALFSQDSKFRAATAPAQAPTGLAAKAATEQLKDTLTMKEKSSKKRKHRELEAPEALPATVTDKSKTSAKLSKVSNKAITDTKSAAVSPKVKDTSAKVAPKTVPEQQHLPARLPKSKNKRQKTAADDTKQPASTSATHDLSKHAAVPSGVKSSASKPAPSVPSQGTGSAAADAEEQPALQASQMFACWSVPSMPKGDKA